MEKNKVKINICKTDYTIVSEDTPEYITSIAKKVDEEMENILKNNTRFSVTMAAVLTALKYCDELSKSISDCDNLRNQMKNYLEDSSLSRFESDEIKKENSLLKKEIQSLRKRLSSDIPNISDDNEAPPLSPVPISSNETDDVEQIKIESI